MQSSAIHIRRIDNSRVAHVRFSLIWLIHIQIKSEEMSLWRALLRTSILVRISSNTIWHLFNLLPIRFISNTLCRQHVLSATCFIGNRLEYTSLTIRCLFMPDILTQPFFQYPAKRRYLFSLFASTAFQIWHFVTVPLRMNGYEKRGWQPFQGCKHSCRFYPIGGYTVVLYTLSVFHFYIPFWLQHGWMGR